MLTSSALWLRHSFPQLNHSRGTGWKLLRRARISFRRGRRSLPTSSTHVLFDFLRRPAPSFVIWRRSAGIDREKHSCPALSFPAAFEKRVASHSSSAGRNRSNITDLPCHFDGSPDSQRIRRWLVNNAWKNYHLEPETLAARKTQVFGVAPWSFSTLSYTWILMIRLGFNIQDTI